MTRDTKDSKDAKDTSKLKESLKAGRDAVAAQERKVIILTGGVPGQEGRTHRLDKDRIVLGSVVSADVRLSGDGVAPIHAVLELVPEPMVYDLASETGVFVNGSKVITGPIKSGDELTIGLHRLRFTVEDRAQVVSQVGRDRVRDTQSSAEGATAAGRALFINPDEDLRALLLEESREVDEIFDYRPATKTALEVVMSWCGSILDVEHFVHHRQVTLGTTRRDDFVVPPVLSSPRHPFVTRTGEEYVLNLDGRMRGVVQRRGSLQTLEQIRTTATPGPSGCAVSIGADDFAKITVGEIDFYLSFTQAPPRLKRSRMLDRDPLFRKIFTASMMLTVATLYGLSTMRTVPSLEAEQIPERIATILYQPEKYAPRPKLHEPAPRAPETKPASLETATPPKPVAKIDVKPNPSNAHKPVPKAMNSGASRSKATAVAKRPAPSKGQTGAKEGEGARGKGAEGSRGARNAARDATPQNRAQAPSPNGGKGAGGGNSQVADVGNVDFLKGASGKIENILGNAGAQLGKSGDSLKGLGGFDTRGNGGLALAGKGKGGGGSSELAAGLGDKGRGFGRVGTGLGAAGNGNGIIGGQVRVAIRAGGNEEAVVMGSIDADAIDAAMRAHQDEFRLCYEREINAEHPNIGGRVGTAFVIGPAGRVSEAGIESTTLKNVNVEGCILMVIKRIDFPVPRGGGLVQVTYPFKFSPVGR